MYHNIEQQWTKNGSYTLSSSFFLFILSALELRAASFHFANSLKFGATPAMYPLDSGIQKPFLSPFYYYHSFSLLLLLLLLDLNFVHIHDFIWVHY